MVYNLEYEVLDSIGRGGRSTHDGVYACIESVEQAKQKLINQYGDGIRFSVYPIENLFTKVSQS